MDEVAREFKLKIQPSTIRICCNNNLLDKQMIKQIIGQYMGLRLNKINIGTVLLWLTLGGQGGSSSNWSPTDYHQVFADQALPQSQMRNTSADDEVTHLLSNE